MHRLNSRFKAGNFLASSYYGNKRYQKNQIFHLPQQIKFAAQKRFYNFDQMLSRLFFLFFNKNYSIIDKQHNKKVNRQQRLEDSKIHSRFNVELDLQTDFNTTEIQTQPSHKLLWYPKKLASINNKHHKVIYSMQYQHNFSQSHKSLTTADDSRYEQIIRSIQNLDRQNQKLVNIADNIMKTSFLRQVEQTPAVILQLQEELKSSFNELIESIREFFISIDNKLKILVSAIQKKVQISPDLCRSKFSSKAQSDKIDTLTVRMGVLQDNMKRAQQNQARLINILQEMNKRKSYDQQPTILKESPKGHRLAHNYSQLTESQRESSFRLFSLGQGSEQKCMFSSSQVNPTYKRFEQYSNYPVLQSQGPYNNKKVAQNGQFFCSGERRQSQKITIKQGNIGRQGLMQSELQSSNRIHRLSNLMKALKN